MKVFVNQSPNKAFFEIVNLNSTHFSDVAIVGKGSNKEEFKNIRVVEFINYNNSNSFFRVFTWLIFTFQLFLFLFLRITKISELFFVSNPPTLILLVILKLFNKRMKLYYLVYDLYPDILKIYFKNKFINILLVPIELINNYLFSKINVVFVISKTMKKLIQKIYKGKIQLIYNWVDTSIYLPIKKTQNPFFAKHKIAVDRFNLLYSGNMGFSHDIPFILNTLSRFEENLHNFNFIFIGGGYYFKEVNKLSKKINCYILPYQQEKSFKYSLSSGDLAIISYKKGYASYSLPSKLPYFLSVGTPILYIGNRNDELAILISDNNLGYVVENDNYEDFLNTLIQITKEKLDILNLNCRDFAIKNFDKITSYEKFDLQKYD